MKRFIKTFHDIALGFFVNAGYTMSQGGDIIANGYVIFFAIVTLFLTNKGD